MKYYYSKQQEDRQMLFDDFHRQTINGKPYTEMLKDGEKPSFNDSLLIEI